VVEVSPVRAWHPNPEAGEASRLVCPVYDTLSDEDVRRYARHPSNAARFVPRPRNLPLPRFLETAAARLDEALHDGAYVRDPRPSYYVYGIRYVPPADVLETIEPDERRAEYLLLGLVGALDLERAGHTTVALHERTFDDRVEERMALTEATGKSFAPIMAGYHLPDHGLNDLLEQLLGLNRRRLAFESARTPVVEATLDGTTHRLWKIDDGPSVTQIRAIVAELRLLVLDGHHRYTAAARRHDQGRPSAPLVMLVDGQDRALRVLPWHRVLPARVRPFDQVLGSAQRAFPHVARLAATPTPAAALRRLREMHRTGRRGFLAAHGDALYEVHGTPEVSDVGSDFDLLHSFLEASLGIDPHELLFVRSPRTALDRLTTRQDPGEDGTALLLPPITELGIEERAFGSGRVMAHKSTMFLPKVAEGLIFGPADGRD